MDPIVPAEESTQNTLPFALRVFILFASSVCAGAGFALTLWSLPLITPRTPVERAVSDAQHVLHDVVPTPCRHSHCGDTPPVSTRDATTPESKAPADEMTETAQEIESPIKADKLDLLAQAKQPVRAAPAPLPPKQKKVSQKKTQPAPKTTQQKTTVQNTAPTRTAPALTQQTLPTGAALVKLVSSTTVKNCVRGTYSLPGPIAVDTNNPGLHVSIDEPQYYTVFGNSANEIRRQMAQCSPVPHGFDAVTNWWYRYSYNYIQKENGLCTAKDITIGLHISYVFPFWDSTGAPENLAREWNRYFSSLKTHEFGHKDITVSLAQEALQTLQNLPDYPCTQIVQSVNAVADQKLNAIQQKNDSYDSSTNHGETQGAHFP